MNEKVVNAALLGLGTVGTGVYKVIKSQEQEMTAKLGCQVKITKILVRNLEKASGKVDDPSVLTTDWADIEGDPSIDIVIELIGGIEPARIAERDGGGGAERVARVGREVVQEDGADRDDRQRHQCAARRGPWQRRSQRRRRHGRRACRCGRRRQSARAGAGQCRCWRVHRRGWCQCGCRGGVLHRAA